MKGVLNDAAIESLYETGYVRTPIRLSSDLIEFILGYYRDLPTSESNFEQFTPTCISQFLESDRESAFAPADNADDAEPRSYDKSIYSTSPALERVLQECIEQGLRDYLSEIDLLAGHDIYLESDRNRATFGFHYDPFAFSVFYQSGDDITLYVALQPLNAETGGRLLVERQANRGVAYEERNRSIERFAAVCAKYVEPDDRGLIRRDDVFDSPHRREIATALVQMLQDRHSFPVPSMRNLRPLDVEAGEVFLFNNKNYHAVEPWKLTDVPRRNYVIRTYPMYDFGLAPPATFLNDRPCNRFLIGNKDGELRPVDPDSERFSFYPVPSD